MIDSQTGMNYIKTRNGIQPAVVEIIVIRG